MDPFVSSDLTRRALLGGAGLSAFALFMSGCAPGQQPTPKAPVTGPPRRGGSLTWALEADPASLAPFGTPNQSGVQVKDLIYESLVTWDKDLNVQPALAEDWEVPDDKTYIFKLRKGVKFHNGDDFTAEDVKYSFDLQKSPPPPGTVTSFYPKVAEVEIVDDHTIKLNMSQPDGTVLGYCAWLTYSFIARKGLYDDLDPRNAANGTGPFKLDAYVPNDHVALTRHDQYWQEGRPYLDGITLKILPDIQARLANLISGQIDGCNLNADIARTLANNPNVVVQKRLNAAFREVQFTNKGKGEPWGDVRVRQAINLAIDRQKMINNIYAGEAQLTSKIPPSYGDWPIPQEELASTYEKHDLEKAKALMRDAGLEDGFKVTLEALSTPDDYVQIAQMMKEQLAEINIEVTVQPLEIGTFAKNNAEGNFQWQSTGRGMRGDPSGYFSDFDPAGSNYKAWFAGGYRNDELTELINKGIGETDEAKRKEIYTRMQEIVLTEWPTLPIVAIQRFQAQRSRVQGMYVAVEDSFRGLPEAWVSE